MKLNTHNIKMYGLKKASGATRNIGAYNPFRFDVYFNVHTGEVIVREEFANNFIKFDDPYIMYVCTTREHLTMQQIADKIAERGRHWPED